MTVTQATKELSNVTGRCQPENAGTGFKEVQAHRCQQSVCLDIIAVPMHRAGWVTHIPQWAREPSNAKYVSIGHQAAVNGPVILTFVTVVVSLCTSWLNHRDATCDTVERHFKVVEIKPHSLSYLHFKYNNIRAMLKSYYVVMSLCAVFIFFSLGGSPPPPSTPPPVISGELSIF